MRMGEREIAGEIRMRVGSGRQENQGGRVPTDARQLNSIAKKIRIRTWVAMVTGLHNSSHQLEKRRGICRIRRLLGQFQFDVGRCDFARLIAVAECVTWAKCSVTS